MVELDLTQFELLSFDCYGTLIDWESGIAAALSGWTASHGLTLSRDELLEAFAAVEPEVEHRHPTMPYRELLALVHAELGGRLGIESTPADAAEFGNSVGNWPAFADSADALETLHRHFKLMILSNVDARSFAASRKRLGIEFDAVVTAEQVGAYKPDHRMFEAAFDAAADLGVERNRILHVAQSLFHDHVPAGELGMKTVWVDRRRGLQGSGATPIPQGPVEPDLVVSSMAELAGLVEETENG